MDPRRTVRICDPPLRQLDLRKEQLVLGPARSRLYDRPSFHQYRVLLESWKGFMDPQRKVCRLGAPGAKRAVLLPPQLGRPSRGGREQRKYHPDQHRCPELRLCRPRRRDPPERLLWREGLPERAGGRRKPNDGQQLPCSPCYRQHRGHRLHHEQAAVPVRQRTREGEAPRRRYQSDPAQRNDYSWSQERECCRA